MKTPITLSHEFVESFPDKLESGKLYVSIEFATVAHSCACGCGHQVITPLSPAEWQLTFDGESISLRPSIGNWSFDCQSHYWIEKNRVRWAPKWSRHEIESVREYDRREAEEYYTDTTSPVIEEPVDAPVKTEPQTYLAKMLKWLSALIRR